MEAVLLISNSSSSHSLPLSQLRINFDYFNVSSATLVMMNGTYPIPFSKESLLRLEEAMYISGLSEGDRRNESLPFLMEEDKRLIDYLGPTSSEVYWLYQAGCAATVIAMGSLLPSSPLPVESRFILDGYDQNVINYCNRVGESNILFLPANDNDAIQLWNQLMIAYNKDELIGVEASLSSTLILREWSQRRFPSHLLDLPFTPIIFDMIRMRAVEMIESTRDPIRLSNYTSAIPDLVPSRYGVGTFSLPFGINIHEDSTQWRRIRHHVRQYLITSDMPEVGDHQEEFEYNE